MGAAMLALRRQSAPPYRRRRLFPVPAFPWHGMWLYCKREDDSVAEDEVRALEMLLDEIRAEAFATRQYTGRAAFDPRVLAALRRVPRHAFVPAELRQRAYANHPLPIGHGQTISQPYIVALMTDLIDPGPDDVVLEIGTGSGYQAAVLATLVKRVYTMDIVDALAGDAGARLRQLGYHNVDVRSGNGRLGWPEHAPYDAILVAAAARSIPPALIEQLKPGGTLVIPVGGAHESQELMVLGKDAQGRMHERSVLPVVFVPLTGTGDGYRSGLILVRSKRGALADTGSGLRSRIRNVSGFATVAAGIPRRRISRGGSIMGTHENKTKVTLLTGSYRIKGYIDLLPGARVTDYMQEAKEFVAVMDAEVYEAEVAGRQVLTAAFINVNRNHIEIVTLG